MANPSPVTAAWDPTTPLGSESLRAGPSRIRSIPTGILDLLGLLDSAPASIISPIQNILPPTFDSGLSGDDTGTQLQAWRDPVDALAYATKRYADRRVLLLFGTGGPSMYSATVPPPLLPASFTLDSNALYLFFNSGVTFDGSGLPTAPTLSINLLGPTVIVRLDGSELAAGDLVSGGLYALAFNVGRFYMLGFVGGTLHQPLILAGDPTNPAPAPLLAAATPLQAATKRYVDGTIAHPVRIIMPTPTKGMSGTTDIWDSSTAPGPITTPNDGNNYLLHGEYVVYYNSPGAANPPKFVQFWLDDGTNQWAVSGQGNSKGDTGGIAPFCFSGSGAAAVLYDAHAPQNKLMKTSTTPLIPGNLNNIINNTELQQEGAQSAFPDITSLGENVPGMNVPGLDQGQLAALQTFMSQSTNNPDLQNARAQLSELTSGPIGSSPATTAGMTAFNQLVAPQIMQDQALQGTASGGAALQAVSQGATQAAVPLIQQEIQNREAGVGQSTAIGQQQVSNLAQALEASGLPREVALQQAQALFNQQQQQWQTQLGIQTQPFSLYPLTIGSETHGTMSGLDYLGAIGQGLSPSGLFGG